MMPPIAGLPNAKSAQCETSIVLDQHPKPKFQQQSQISTVNVELNTKCTNANCTNAQVHKCQMLKCTNAQMLKCQMSSAKCTNAQMHECTKAQMLNAQIPNTKYQMHKCTNAQMHKCTNAQMHKHKCTNTYPTSDPNPAMSSMAVSTLLVTLSLGFSCALRVMVATAPASAIAEPTP